MGDDLKPCPWCGAAAEFFHGGVRRYARCSNAEAAGGACSVGYRTDDDWNRRPAEDALRARAEAAEARAAQAEADARLMLAELYYADERCIFDDRLPLDERTAVSGMARAHVSTPRAAWVEAVRRILAAGGAA